MHFAKYGKQEVMKLFEHYTRESSRAHYIDKSRSKDNDYIYNGKIAEFEETYKPTGKYPKSDTITNYMLKEIDRRCRRKTREDSVLMVDLIITQPKELGQTKDQAFFDKCMQVLERDYIKKDNFLMASIHTDERKDGQPHLHYSFIPLIEDKKKGGEKLCAKEFLNLKFLKSFHQDMERKTGYKLTLEDDKVRNLTMKEYQNKKDIEKLQKDIKEQEKQIEQLKENQKENEKKILPDYKKYYTEMSRKFGEYESMVNSFVEKYDLEQVWQEFQENFQQGIYR